MIIPRRRLALPQRVPFSMGFRDWRPYTRYWVEITRDPSCLRAEIHCFIPGDFSVAHAILGAIGRGTVWLFAPVALPNPVRAISMAGGPVHHANPEHGARPLGGDLIHQHLVTCFAINDRHDWAI